MAQTATPRTSRNSRTVAEPQVLSASDVKQRLAAAFAQDNRPISGQELNTLVFIRQGITINSELADFIDSVAGAVDCILVSGESKWITNAMLRGSSRGGNGIRWLTQPVNDSQIDFMDRHASWMEEKGLPRPSIVSGFQRLIRFHQTDFGVGENNTCSVCQSAFENRAQQSEARNAERQELLAKAAAMFTVRSDRQL